MLTTDVQAAISELERAFVGHALEVERDGKGGARVVVPDLLLGPSLRPCSGWVGFSVGFQYPAADVYPHFAPADLTRIDGRSLGAGFSRTTWAGRPAVQISRRSAGWTPGVDSAATKLMKVLEWLRSQ